MTIQEIIQQLEACNYECQAGSLVNNEAFMQLKQRADHIDLVPVASSNIKGVGYSEERGIMRIRFKNGNIYDFSGTNCTIP